MNKKQRQYNLTQAELNYRRSERITELYTKFTIVFSALLLVAFVLYWVFHKTKNQKLFYKHFVPIEVSLINEKNNTDKLVNKAILLYNKEQYEESVERWKEVLKKEPKNDTIHYFTGMTYLALDKQNLAIFHLNKVLLNSNSIYLQEAYYYLGLANLKADNPLVANKYLSFVENRDVKKIQKDIKF